MGADWEYTIPCEGSIATSAAYFRFNDSDSYKKDFQEIKTYRFIGLTSTFQMKLIENLCYVTLKRSFC